MYFRGLQQSILICRDPQLYYLLVLPCNLVVFDQSSRSLTAMLGRIGIWQMPLDEGTPGNEGDIVEVDNLLEEPCQVTLSK